MAKIDIWIPVYISDYLSDTMDLTTEEHGMYFLLMMHYWKKGILTDDIKKLQVITKIPTENLQVLSRLLNEYFHHDEDGHRYTNKRLERELNIANNRRKSASERGKMGGRPKKEENKAKKNLQVFAEKAIGSTKKTSSPSPSPSQIPIPSKKRERRFAPPTQEEATEYFLEIKSTETEASKFFDHFTSNGWKVGGKAPMKDWRAAARNWIRRNKEKVSPDDERKKRKEDLTRRILAGEDI